MQHTRATRSRTFTSTIAALGVALLAGVAVLGGALAAQAAPPYATNGSVDSVSFSRTTVTSGTATKLNGTWSLPDGDVPDTRSGPFGLTLSLPDELVGVSMDFPLLDSEGTAAGECTVSAGEMYCDIDADYVATHPLNVHGTFSLWVTVTTEVTEETQTTYDFDDQTASITVVPPARCETDCGFTGRDNAKVGVYDRANDRVIWTVNVKAPVGGMAGGETVTVTDTPGPDQEFLTDGFPRVVHTQTVATVSDGSERPTNFTVKTDGVETSIDGGTATVTFTTEAGYYYDVQFVTRPTDGDVTADRTYTNAATVKIGSEDTVPVSASAFRQGGGATAIGDSVGRFTVTKEVTGTATGLPDREYTGTYTVTQPTDGTVTDTFSVTADGTWTSPLFEAGSTIELAEDPVPGTDGIAWTSSFSSNDFTLTGGQLTPVTLTNTVNLRLGNFSVVKEIDGDAADLVGEDATFTVDYSYPAGTGYPAGSGSLTVPGDGTVVTSPSLPAGAVVSLAEQAPATIDGAQWTAAVFSQDAVNVVADETTAVTLTNTIQPQGTTPGTETPTPTPTVTPSTPAPTTPASEAPGTSTPSETPGGVLPGNVTPGLPATGGQFTPMLIGAGIIAALVGAGLLVGARRRTH